MPSADTARKPAARSKPEPAGASGFPTGIHLPPLLRRCWFNLNQTFRRRIAHLGVTPDQFTVMRTLHENASKGLSQSELAVMITSDPNTIASLVERMEAMGLVGRKPHEKDRRAYRLLLKPAGKRKFEEVRNLAVELQSEILQAIPSDRRDEFLSHLSLVADACRLAAEKPLAPSRG
jgi:DNA-binding MarR family transcriptional regulator